MIIDTLITNRTQADVDRVTELTQKFLLGTITTEEKAEYMAGMKGAYNYTDLNRVGETVAYIANIMNQSGRSVSVTAKSNWTVSDIPTLAQMTAFLRDLSLLKTNSTATTQVPSSMDRLTYQRANQIEQLLVEAYNSIIREGADWEKCGVAISGLEGGLL